ncbi:MAG TPA: VIT domain-containing protein [Nostocaceae cyanobacterium]|nr:VIT domain-containing protein [Nostocaceae cyanobacterium]
MSTKIKQHQVGRLYAHSPNGKELVFPLKHTEVQAKIAGNLSRVEVIQSFENPFTQPLEAIYVFPLPDEAAVDEMEIKINEKIIKGSIKKREEAQQIYQQAKREGRTTGLLEQERDNIFTQSLANILPGEQIYVTILYTDSLKFSGGNYEFVFPMVVGPRYIPGTPIDGSGDTDQVPDASRITPPIIPAGMRSRHDININVEIHAGLPVHQIVSPSHQLQIEQNGEIVKIQLAGEDTIPNKDFILRYQVAGKATQATVLTQKDQRGGHFALYFIPALEYKTTEIVAKDVVFLIDTSGSQHGAPLQQCQELMRRFINGLNPDDTFTIIDFSETTRQLSSTPLPNTPTNRTKAISYIDKLKADGGTQLLNGIQAVLQFPVTSNRLRSIVLLTDGYIGNENQILAEVKKKLKPGNRLYSFGAGSSVNRFLLNRIAEIGRGTSTIIRHDEPVQEVVEKFFKEINNPVLTNIEIIWEGAGEPPTIYPTAIPDLFAQQPLVLFGKQPEAITGKLYINGITAGGKTYEKTFDLKFEFEGNTAIAQLWGRAKIKDLMNQMFSYETTEKVEAVTETALTYQLLSQYTAFIAVSEDIRVDGDSEIISVQVPVEMPEAVSYDGIVAASAPSTPIVRSMGRKLASPRSSAKKVAYSQVDEFADFDMERERGISIPEYYFSAPAAPADIPDANAKIEVVKITGLDDTARLDLAKHLASLIFDHDFYHDLHKEIVFTCKISQGRVRQVMLDEKNTNFLDVEVIEDIKQLLLTWLVPEKKSMAIRITLRLQEC